MFVLRQSLFLCTLRRKTLTLSTTFIRAINIVLAFFIFEVISQWNAFRQLKYRRNGVRGLISTLCFKFYIVTVLLSDIKKILAWPKIFELAT